MRSSSATTRPPPKPLRTTSPRIRSSSSTSSVPGQPRAGGAEDLQPAGRGAGLRERRLTLAGEPDGVLLGAHAVGDVVEVDAQAVVVGRRADVEPGVQRRVVLLEADRPAGLHRLAVGDVALGAPQVGVGLPQRATDQLLAAPPEDRLRRGVEIGEAPVACEREERGAHRLQHAAETFGGAVDGGRVVGRAEHPRGPPVGAAEHSPTRGDPAHRAVGVDHAIVGLVLAAAVDGAADRRLDALAIVWVQPGRERVDVRDVGLRVVAEELHQPVVPVQRVGHQVPVEAADRRRLEAQIEPHGAVLELRREGTALELARHRPRQVAQDLDVVVGPLVRLAVVDAQRADALARGDDRDPEEAGDARRPGVGEDQRRAAGDGPDQQRVRARLSRRDRCERHRRVGDDRDLRVGSAEQARAQRGQAVEGLSARLCQHAARRLDPLRVLQPRGHRIRLHPADQSRLPARTCAPQVPAARHRRDARTGRAGSRSPSTAGAPGCRPPARAPRRTTRRGRRRAARTQWANATRTVPGSSQAAKCSGPSSAG